MGTAMINLGAAARMKVMGSDAENEVSVEDLRFRRSTSCLSRGRGERGAFWSWSARLA
jgi:hypothetical protein